MATYYLKNTSGAAVTVADLGLYLPDSRSIAIDSNSINGYLSSDLSAKINAGSLVLSTTDVGDTGGDLSITDAIAALTIVSQIMRSNPNQVTFTQASDADPNTDITALEAEALTNGSDASSLHNHNTAYYTKTLLGASNAGTVKIHWDNLINVPTFGSMQWVEPVKCCLHGMGSSAPSSPSEGWFYINTGDNHIYKYSSSAWVDQGAPSTGDRIIFRDGTNSNDYIYEWSGSEWVGTAPIDNEATLVDDDGDGYPAQYIYSNDETPPDWIKIADVNWGDHSVLTNRDKIGSHPATAISYSNTTSGLTSTTVQAAIDEIATKSGIDVANIYYVAKNGSDTGDKVGTYINPYATIQAAINAIPTSGDSAAASGNRYAVYVQPGYYTENISLSKPYVYIIGVDKKLSVIKSDSGNAIVLSSSIDGGTGLSNIGIENNSSSTTDNGILISGNNPILNDMYITCTSGARAIYITGAYNQTFNNVSVKNGQVRIDAGIVKINNSIITDASLNITSGTVYVSDGDFTYASGNAIEQSNGTVYLISAKLSSGSSYKDYNQSAGTVFWGWVEYNPTKVSFSGTKTLLFLGSDLYYDNLTSGLTGSTVQAAIDNLDTKQDAMSVSLNNHLIDITSNPHKVTLTQTIATDSNTDKSNLTVPHLNAIVDGSNVDTLHKHDATNITFTNSTSGLQSGTVQGAIDALDALVDTGSTALTTHESNTTNPHDVTLTQTIAKDSATDKTNLTVSNLNKIVNSSNADALHKHSASNITYDPTGTTLSSTTTSGAIGELATLIDGAKGIEKGTTFPSSPEAGDLFYRTDLSLFFQYDASRSTWLSIAQMFLDWGSSSADGVYLNIHGATATQTGYLMPRNGKIISITARCASGNQSKTMEIRRNHNSTTPLKQFSLASGQYSSVTEDVSFSAGDYIQAFATSNSIPSRDIVVMVTICWTE